MFNKVEIIYILISILLPVIYLVQFLTYKSRKKKQYGRAVIISLLMFFILIFLGIAFKLAYENIGNIKDNNQTTTTESSITVKKESTTTTVKQTEKQTEKTTKTTKNNNSYNYNKILTPDGGTVIGKTSKGYEIKNVNGLYYVGGYLIANKTYDLPESYNPGQLNTTVKAAADKMFEAAKNEAGFKLYVASGFRSYSTQNNLYTKYANRDGKDKADTYSARPGYSEHQTGLAFDVCDSNVGACITSGFDNTKQAKWLESNCYKYGFILRYVKNKTNETGYMYESWHFRYVGTELAEKLYNNGNWITMEDYFGITSEYGGKIA